MKMLRRTSPTPARTNKSGKAPKGRGPVGGPAEFGRRFTEGISQFVYDTRTELRKVVWPTREQTMNLTGLVIAVSLGVAAFIGAIDFVSQRFFQLLLGGA